MSTTSSGKSSSSPTLTGALLVETSTMPMSSTSTSKEQNQQQPQQPQQRQTSTATPQDSIDTSILGSKPLSDYSNTSLSDSSPDHKSRHHHHPTNKHYQHNDYSHQQRNTYPQQYPLQQHYKRNLFQHGNNHGHFMNNSTQHISNNNTTHSTYTNNRIYHNRLLHDEYDDPNSDSRYYFISETSQSEDLDVSSRSFHGSSGSPSRTTTIKQLNPYQNIQQYQYTDMNHHNHTNSIRNTTHSTNDNHQSNHTNHTIDNDIDMNTDTSENNAVLGNDINIQMKKSASNTSLSSLGSPNLSATTREKQLHSYNYHNPNTNPNNTHSKIHNLNMNIISSKKLFFPSISSSSGTDTTTNQSQQNYHSFRYQHQYVGKLLDGSSSGHISSSGNDHSSDGIDDELILDNSHADDHKNKNGSQDDNDDVDHVDNAGAATAGAAGTGHKRSNSGGSTTFLSPRSESIYFDDTPTSATGDGTGDNNNKSTTTSTPNLVENNETDKDIMVLSSDDCLSETEDGSQDDEDIMKSFSSLLSETTIRTGKSKKLKKKTTNDDDDNDNDGMSYDTETHSSQAEGEDTNDTAGKNKSEIESPPTIEKNIVVFPSFDKNDKDNNNSSSSSSGSNSDTITPKRKTSARLTLKKASADDESKPSKTPRKRGYSDGKRTSKHRRKKSGDDAAATLLTGSPGWAGMELHNLPIPTQENEDEDDYNITGSTVSPIRESRSFGAVNSEGRSHRRSKNRRSISDMSEATIHHSNGRSKSDSSISLAQNNSELNSYKGFMAVEEFSKHALADADATGGVGDGLSSSTPGKMKQSVSPTPTSSKPNLSQSDILDAVSVGSAGSHGTAFSWISNKISLISQKDHDVRSKDGFDPGFIGESSILHKEPLHFTSPIPEELKSAGSSFDQNQRRPSNSFHDDDEGDVVLNMNSTPGVPLQPLLNRDRNQREYFGVTTVPKTFGNPISFMVIYFVFYIILALVIFGLEEGWPPLDCLYFAVMTLTSTGLGDYVPTSNSAKIVCSIFMYFGVACTGLLLGLLHANSLDHASRKATEENMINNNIQSSKEGDEQTYQRSIKKAAARYYSYSSPKRKNRPRRNSLEELPLFRRSLSPISGRRTSLQTIDERPDPWHQRGDSSESARAFRCDDNQSEISSNLSTMSFDDKYLPVTQMKAAKYIILTLQQASANTLFIIGIGSLGFIYFENMTTVDAFYFTMSLLTTVGYGDIRPETPGGKAFASLFVFVAWICLLYNISMISMIPLELRKRRIENVVLNQFGDELDEGALHELISGPLVKRLSSMANDKSELDYCSREMFALTMLIRLGRITEQDVRSTYAAFQKLDRHNEGFISQKEIQGTTFNPVLDNVGNLLPKQRSDNATTLNENSNLLHPLTMNNNTNDKPLDRNKNYMSLSKVPEQQLGRGVMSTESLWSGMTEENWDDHP